MPADLSSTFAALGDPARVAVIAMLADAPARPSDIADALELTRPTTSRHLRVLRQAGLVEEQIQPEDARVRMYRLRKDRFAEMRAWLDEVEAFWGDQLAAFKAHAEKKR